MSPFCTNCGKEVDEAWNICPDCGKVLKEVEAPQVQPQHQLQNQTSPQPPQVQSYQRVYSPDKGNNYGIAALICGITGIPFAFLLIGPFLGIIAIILGIIGISKDNNPAMAIIGVIFGVLSFVVFFLFFFLIFTWLSRFWSWPFG